MDDGVPASPVVSEASVVEPLPSQDLTEPDRSQFAYLRPEEVIREVEVDVEPLRPDEQPTLVERSKSVEPPSIERLELQIVEVELRLSEAVQRAEHSQRTMNEVLASEISSMRDIVNSLDREHHDALSAIRSEAQAEAERIVSDAMTFAVDVDLREADHG